MYSIHVSPPLPSPPPLPPVPSAVVQNVTIENPYGSSELMARVSWSPIPDDQWNGDPLGYSIFLLGEQRFNISFPATWYVISNLTEGKRYTVAVAAVNHKFVGALSRTITFRTGK